MWTKWAAASATAAPAAIRNEWITWAIRNKRTAGAAATAAATAATAATATAATATAANVCRFAHLPRSIFPCSGRPLRVTGNSAHRLRHAIQGRLHVLENVIEQLELTYDLLKRLQNLRIKDNARANFKSRNHRSTGLIISTSTT
jgi:hypothetical protein